MATGQGTRALKRESRPTWAAERLFICQLGGDNNGLSITSLQLQRLRLLGIIGQRAKLLAALAWEVADARQ